MAYYWVPLKVALWADPMDDQTEYCLAVLKDHTTAHQKERATVGQMDHQKAEQTAARTAVQSDHWTVDYSAYC